MGQFLPLSFGAWSLKYTFAITFFFCLSSSVSNVNLSVRHKTLELIVYQARGGGNSILMKNKVTKNRNIYIQLLIIVNNLQKSELTNNYELEVLNITLFASICSIYLKL